MKLYKLLKVCSALSLFIFIACNNEPKNTSSSLLNMNASDHPTIYVSSDQTHEYHVLSNPDSADGMITLRDIKANTDYVLKRVPSASGVKYEDDEGWVFWTKNDEYMLLHNDKEVSKGHLKTTEIKADPITNPSFNNVYFGNYVSESYTKKDNGADWVAVTIKPIDDFRAKVSVRSRADKKKATCTFDGIATVTASNTLKLTDNATYIVLSFTNNQLAISTEPESDISKLNFYCSGGGSLANTYTKINGALDRNQIDKTGYAKSLFYNDYIFFITETNGQLKLTPVGLSETNTPIVQTISGTVVNAEIDDLNNDTYPEVFIYTQDENDSKGKVYGYSVNNGKSISAINIPELSTLTDINSGYQGHDEFAMVEGTFVQRFPIYADGKPSGKTKQIQYVLEDGGEAARQLVADKVLEY